MKASAWSPKLGPATAATPASSRSRSCSAFAGTPTPETFGKA